MCGIAGIVNIGRNAEVASLLLDKLIAAVQDCEPDGFGLDKDNNICFIPCQPPRSSYVSYGNHRTEYRKFLSGQFAFAI